MQANTAPGPEADAAQIAALQASLAELSHENAVLTRHLAAAQARCTAMGCRAAANTPATASMPAAPGNTRQRRRLHQLPATAQDLLLAMSLPPPALRATIEQALARQRGQPVQLQGSDADVLYSCLHDLGARNALSDALHRRLEARHAATVQRLSRLRDPQALREAWLQTLEHASQPQDDIPGLLWALLTHPLGQEQEVRALAEARAWLHEQARRGLRASASHASALQAKAQLAAEVQALQRRLQEQQQRHEQALLQAERQAAALAGEKQRWQALAEAAALPASPSGGLAPWPSAAPLPAAHRSGETGTHAPPRQLAPPAPPSAPPRRAAGQPLAAALPASPCAAAAAAAGPAAGSAIQGRRVLCVGGIQHAVARYRSRIETLGGRFEHHDGGIHDNAHGLDGRLARADLVICQAGCINHAAYHRIKQHCQRTGTPCVYLERASLSRFDRALQALQAGSAPRPN